MDCIDKHVIDLVAKQTAVQAELVRRESRFVEDLKADSLDCVELVMELEDGFDLAIPDKDAAGLLTVGQLIDYVRQRAAAAEASAAAQRWTRKNPVPAAGAIPSRNADFNRPYGARSIDMRTQMVEFRCVRQSDGVLTLGLKLTMGDISEQAVADVKRRLASAAPGRRPGTGYALSLLVDNELVYDDVTSEAGFLAAEKAFVRVQLDLIEAQEAKART